MEKDTGGGDSGGGERLSHDEKTVNLRLKMEIIKKKKKERADEDVKERWEC